MPVFKHQTQRERTGRLPSVGGLTRTQGMAWQFCLACMLLGLSATAELRASPVPTIWIDGTGTWTDPANWSSNPYYPNNGSPAGMTYDISLPDTGSPYTVSLGTSVTINSLHLDSATLVLSNNAVLNFSGNQTLGGVGEVVLSGYASSHTPDTIAPSAGSTLTIGPDVTVRTGTAVNGAGGVVGSNGGLINNGIISCQHAGNQLTLTGTNWANNGLIRVSDGYLILAGLTSTASLGNIQHTGGNLVFSMTLDNVGQTLNIDPLGTVILDGCTINGGTIRSTGSAQLSIKYGATLNGVTLGANLTHTYSTGADKTVVFEDGLTLLNHDISIRAGNRLLGTDTSTLGGTGQIIVDDVPSGSNHRSTIGGSSITIGPDVTIRTGTSASNAQNYVTVNTVLNQGTISADSTSLPITVTNDSVPWINAGTLRTTGGGLAASGTWTNTGTISATGGYLTLYGTWVNDGSITASNATVSLGGTGSGLSGIAMDNCSLNISGYYTTAQIREISMTATSLGVISWDLGVLDNTNDTLTLAGPSGDFRLDGGTLRGGVVQSPDNHKIVCTDRHLSVLDGVRLEVPLVGTSAGVRAYNLDNRSTITFIKDEQSIYEPGLALYGPWSNTGSICISDGYLLVGGPPAEQGSITISDSHCYDYASLTTAQIRNISTSKVVWHLDYDGLLDNTGDALILSQDGNRWTCHGGTIKGGTIQSPDGTALGISKSSSHGFTSMTLDGVTLATDVRITGSDTEPTIINGVTLTNNSTIYFNADYATFQFSGTQTINGTGTIVVNGANDNHSVLASVEGTLTIGPDIVVRNDTHSCFLTGDIVNQGLLSARTASRKITVNGSLTNEGAVEVRDGGTLLFNTAPTNLSGAQLTGGSWRAFANSTVRLVGANIHTNAAEIILDGPGANFYNAATGTTSALASFSLNATGGRFTLRNGRDFTAPGPLSNAGIIMVGSGTTLTVPGELTNTESGTLTGLGTIRADVVCFGSIAPGDSLGTLSFAGNLTLAPGAELEFELGPPAASDKIAMSSAVLTLSGQQFSDFTFTPCEGFGPGDYVLIDAGAIQGSLGASTSGLINGLPASLAVIPAPGGGPGSDLMLRVVPEPSTAVLLGVSAVGLLTCAWRRRQARWPRPCRTCCGRLRAARL